jgi:hypothetical protein
MAVRMLDHKKVKIQAKQQVFGKPNQLITCNQRFICSDTVNQDSKIGKYLEIEDPESFVNPLVDNYKDKITKD